MSGKEDNPYAEYTQVSDWFIFATLTLAEIYVFIRLKFNLDFSGKLTLLLHFCVSGIRIFYSSQKIMDLYQKFSIVLSNNLVYLSLYYFVFEL